MSRDKDGCLAVIVSLLVMLPIAIALYAWAAMLNWNWFATTLGAPRIGFFQAYGLSLVVSSFIGGESNKEKDNRALSEIMIESLVHVVIRFIIFASAGYGVHLLMRLG